MRVQEDRYPIYRRRNDGSEILIPRRGAGTTDPLAPDNCWIVPYNPYLSWHYKAHITVEVCASIQSIKYIHQYIYKSSDRTTAQLGSDGNEVQRHLHGRYVGPTEAVWCLFGFGMHGEFPAVMHLAIHLPSEQPVYFSDRETAEDLSNRMESARSTLRAYFQYNALHSDGPQYLYQDFPTHYTYNTSRRVWTPRKSGINWAHVSLESHNE